jgi:hypothetical protein
MVVGAAGLALAPGLLQGCSQTGVGDPCVPEQEYSQTFLGFDPGEVNVESKSFDCETRLCLANHFRGRVSCPYGQGKNGLPTLNGSSAYQDLKGQNIGGCEIPGSPPPPSSGVPLSANAITGSGDPTVGATVDPQCADRQAAQAVYCSCRCANVNGQTNDGAAYCTCPSGFVCQQLVTPIGPTDTGLTGAYCIRQGTQYNAQGDCQSNETGTDSCDPSQAQSPNKAGFCGTFNGQ